MRYNALQQAGMPVNGIDPRRLQLFRNGQEQVVFVQGESDGVFNASDYVEFYADKNDGSLDAPLYRSAAEQPSTYYSLFTDTAYYFLTLLPDTSVIQPKRFSPFADFSYSAYTPESFFISNALKTY